jgi:ATP-dependent helicase HrpB
LPRQNATRDLLPELPIHGSLSELRKALSRGHAVLSAEPGSGKTTLVPLLLQDESWLDGRKILMLEPRRPAARMAARRMATLLGEAVGETVGYQVRFERKVSARTRIEVLTEGLLLRRLQADPELKGVGLLIFDEFHERNLQGDLSLALSLDVASALRDDLRLLVMSASLDAQPLVAMMSATAIDAPGRVHPVEISHADGDADLRNPVPGCMRALVSALSQTAGDVLVFLPGRREIERMCAEVAATWRDEVDALTLYGEMPAADQDAVLRGGGPRRRVIMTTDIAETSLTIEGVEAVVDSGLARKPAFEPNTGLTRLETRRISKASALQRAGRAGRLGPGHCYRSWTLARQARMEDWTVPELMEADLAPLVLELANWGVVDAAELRWLDPPPEAHWQQAVELLRQLGAVDEPRRITSAGRRMARFPAHPRLAHVLVAASNRAEQLLAADVAALLSERDPLRRGEGRMRTADLGLRLDALAAMRQKGSVPAGFDRASLRQVDKVAQQFLRLCDEPTDRGGHPMGPGQCLALAYPDRVAMRTSTDGRRYLMRNGRAALLDESDPLRASPFLAIAGVDAGRREGIIWLAATMLKEEFEELFAEQIREQREVRWDPGKRDVVARFVRRLDAILLSDEAVALRADDPVPQLLLEQIRQQGLAAFFDDPLDLRARVQLMRSVDDTQDWPDFSEQGLLDSLDEWLLPWLRNGEGARQLRGIRLQEVLAGSLGWERVQLLDQRLPAHFETPAGTRRRIQYGLDGSPVLAVPLQEMLGLREGPVLADGRVPLVLHLLSPAGRPLQLTTDLAAFWAGAYVEVKKEMRGRYPKHYWPDDPAASQATRFSKRRMKRDS